MRKKSHCPAKGCPLYEDIERGKCPAKGCPLYEEAICCSSRRRMRYNNDNNDRYYDRYYDRSRSRSDERRRRYNYERRHYY